MMSSDRTPPSPIKVGPNTSVCHGIGNFEVPLFNCQLTASTLVQFDQVFGQSSKRTGGLFARSRNVGKLKAFLIGCDLRPSWISK